MLAIKKINYTLIHVMRIAILLHNEKLPDDGIVQAYTFSVEDHVVTSVGSELLYLQHTEYVAFWLTSNHIDVVYTNNTDENLKETLNKVEVTLKPFSEIKNNPLLSLFLIDYN